MDNGLIVFASTFGGVFLSFLLWFGGTHFFQWRSAQNSRTALKQELRQEVQLNIAKLDDLAAVIPKMLENKTVPLYLPARMTLAAFHQAMSTGQLRLFRDIKSQSRIRMLAEVFERFNGFIDNSELIGAICLLRPDGLATWTYRCKQLVEQAKETKEAVQKMAKEIKLG